MASVAWGISEATNLVCAEIVSTFPNYVIWGDNKKADIFIADIKVSTVWSDAFGFVKVRMSPSLQIKVRAKIGKKTTMEVLIKCGWIGGSGKSYRGAE